MPVKKSTLRKRRSHLDKACLKASKEIRHLGYTVTAYGLKKYVREQRKIHGAERYPKTPGYHKERIEKIKRRS